MSDHTMVCKHCGGGDFFAEVRVESWVDGDVLLDDDGKPHFESTGGPQDTFDYEIDQYVCNGCRKSHWKLEELVVPPPAVDQPIAPCGRCDHSRVNHPEKGFLHGQQPYYERGPMPCTHEGCDCHDYYDTAVVGDIEIEVVAA